LLAAGCTSDATDADVPAAPAADAAAMSETQSTMEPGDITETIAPQPTETALAVDLDDTAAFSGGVTATITQVVSVQTEADLPGEIAGPGVALTVEIVNGSADPIDLGATLVDLIDADGLSATQIVQGTEPHTGTLAPGESMFGTYVFGLGEAQRRDVTVQLSYTTDEPIVVFTGDLADQE
jgi:hypothetical protein